MSDITKCPADGCPVKEKCYRFTAKPNEFYQSYFTESPFVIKDNTFTCDMYWGENASIVMSELKKIIKGEYNKPNTEVKQRQKRKK